MVALDQGGVIMTTYTEDGLANGYVYLTYQDIFDVDFESDDLAKMEQRIQMAQRLKLIDAQPVPYQLNQKVALLTQVLGTALVEQQALLLTLQDGTMLEGFVTAVERDHVKLRTFDKFDNREAGQRQLDQHQICSAEFLGTELRLLGQSHSLLFRPHLEPLSETTSLKIFAILNRACENGQRVIMVPKLKPELFFIGQVRAVNANAAVFAVVDMNGLFGGYELIRLDEIGQVIIKSDYLRLLNHFVGLNLSQGTYRQPLLNDERAFDKTVDLFQMILEQSRRFKRLVRIKLTDGTAYFGLPIRSRQPGELGLRYFDEDDPLISKRKRFRCSEVVEIAFDYLDAELTKQQFLGHH